jgi:hypothetical protein
MRSSGTPNNPIFTERTMNERRFEPGETGWGEPAPQNRAVTPSNDERRQAGTPATLDRNIEKAFDETEDTGKHPQWQAYPARWLKWWYGLSQNFAVLLAAELRWGEL